jgi:pyruvate dehydrogenase E2 component (dihydrolipoamide acetyltransferase)
VIAVLLEEGESADDIGQGWRWRALRPRQVPRKPAPGAGSPIRRLQSKPMSAECRSDTACTACRWESGSSPRRWRGALPSKTGSTGAVSGSGPHGRIIKADVEAAIAGGTGKAAAGSRRPGRSVTSQPAAPAGHVRRCWCCKLFAEGSYELVPHDGMRKTIAARLTESKQTIPHFYVSVDCQLDALLKLRSELNKAAPVKDGKPAYKLSVNDMVIKALALPCAMCPTPTSPGPAENMVMHKHSDVGVAVSIPGGLITPIVRRAEEKPLSVISNEMKDMASAPRTAS